MITVDSICNDIYIRLGDTDKQVYNINRIIQLINKGLRDVSIRTNMFYRIIHIVIDNEQNIIRLPIDFQRLIYVEDALGKNIGFKTIEEISSTNPNWKEQVGSRIEAIIYNNNNLAQFYIFPKIKNIMNSGIHSNSPYGMITNFVENSIKYTIIDKQEYGMYEIVQPSILCITYNSLPKEIESIRDSVDIAPQVIDLLTMYVVFEALKDNTSTMSMGKASLLQAEYEVALDRYINNTKALNYTEVDRDYASVLFATY